MSEAELPNPHTSTPKLYPHKETALFKQKQACGQDFTLDYKQEVIYPNTIKLFIYAIFVYILYIAIDILLYNLKAIDIAQSERNYLIAEEQIIQAEIHTRLANIKMFVDYYREIAQKKANFTATAPCNSTRFICNQLVDQDLINFGEFGYDMIMENSRHFILSSATKSDAEIFLFNYSGGKKILNYNLHSQLDYQIAPKLIELVSLHSSPAYLIKIIRKQTKNGYEIKALFCGRVPAISSFAQICVVSPANLEDLRVGKSNQVVIISNDALYIDETTTPLELVQSNSSIVQENFIGYNISHLNVSQDDKPFYQSFDLEACVSKYKKTQSLIQNKARVCNPPQILNFLTPVTIFVSSVVELAPRYYKEEIKSPTRINNFEIPFLIFSNTTFTETENKSMKIICQKQYFIIQSMIIILSCWVVMMPIFPLKLVAVNIATSVTLLMKMCKVVKSIKSRDDLELQIDNFNKLNIEINKRNHIFYSTIEYFKYFIWYRKWLYTTKHSKKKQLLDEGLTLFGSVDDVPVYMYIYQKQIQNEAKVAENYNKMRKIFTQKLVLYRDEERIEENTNMDKQRNAVRKCKKSGFSKLEEEMEAGNAYSRDFCMTQSEQKKIQNRINKQLQLMQIQKKSKRYVRFSNDLQQQQKPLQFRVSKFLLNIPSQANIVRFSQQSIEDQMRRKDEEDLGSNPVESSRQDKQPIDVKDQQSSYSEKNIENWNMFLKFDELDESNEHDGEDDFFDLRKISFNKLDDKLCESYENLFRIYEKMINSKKMYFEKQQVIEINQYMNKFYYMLIEKLRYTYKFIKNKNNQREKMLKTLSKKLVHISKEKQLIKQFQRSRREKLLGSEKALQQTISVIEDEIQQESKLIDFQFKEFSELEQKYKIDSQLIEKAQIYQIKMKKILNYPVPYKKLENLCDSRNEQIRVEARVIMAQQFFYISPHADFEVLAKAQQNLQENHTTNVQKQKSLKLIKRVLKNRQFMEQQESQIELIKNYYNYVHKKIYFVVDLSDNYEVFLPTIQQIYKNMNQVDMFQIMNLAMNQILQDMVVNGSQLKPPKLSDFQLKFEAIHNEANRIRSVASTKIGNKKMAFEKDFNRIISKIEHEEINLSKFVVLMLGGENETQSKTHEDYESSSAQNRQNYQVVHQQILSRLEKNYFHMILVGFNLRDYQTRQGKLKKYVRHTHDLFEIDLSKANNERCLKELGKFFSN